MRGVACQLLQVGKYVVEGADNGVAACYPREGLQRDLAEVPVQAPWREPEGPI